MIQQGSKTQSTPFLCFAAAYASHPGTPSRGWLGALVVVQLKKLRAAAAWLACRSKCAIDGPSCHRLRGAEPCLMWDMTSRFVEPVCRAASMPMSPCKLQTCFVCGSYHLCSGRPFATPRTASAKRGQLRAGEHKQAEQQQQVGQDGSLGPLHALQLSMLQSYNV